MVKRVQLIGKTTAELASFLILARELIINTTKKCIAVGDGTTLGGIEIARSDLDNVTSDSVVSKLTTWLALDAESTRFTIGTEAKSQSESIVTTHTIERTDPDELILTLTGNTTITVEAPTSGHYLSKMVKIVQGGAGGFTPTFTGFTWLNTEPTWTGRAAAAGDWVSITSLSDGTKLISHIVGV